MKTPGKAKSTQKATPRTVAKERPDPGRVLIGWPAIAKYLGQAVAVAQRWSKSGMPVERRGRFMTAKAEDLSQWLGKETGAKEPVHISQSGEEDLLADLRRGLKQARSAKRT